MSGSLGRRIAGSFALGLLALVAVEGAVYRSTQRFVDSALATSHAERALSALGELLSSVKDAERGGYAYVVTGEESYLHPYQASRARVEQGLKDVHAIGAGNTAGLEQLIAARFADLKEIVELRHDKGFGPASRLVASGRGKKAMEGLEGGVAALQVEQRSRISALTQGLSERAEAAKSALVWGIVFAVGALGMLAYGLIRSTSGALGELTRAAVELATGNTTVALSKSPRRDEIGRLTNALIGIAHSLARLGPSAPRAEPAAASVPAPAAASAPAPAAPPPSMPAPAVAAPAPAAASAPPPGSRPGTRSEEPPAKAQAKPERGVPEAVHAELSDRLRAVLERVKAVSTQLSSAASDIESVATQVQTSSTETTTAASETRMTVEELRQNAALAHDQARAVADHAALAFQDGDAFRGNLEAAISALQQSREQMTELSAALVRLSEESTALDAIENLLAELSERSRLLAVNAQISAAHSSERAGSFSSLADDLKSVADQARQTLAQTRSILADVYRAVSSAVAAAEHGHQSIESGLQHATHAGQGVDFLSATVRAGGDATRQIADTLHEDTASLDEILVAMDSVRRNSTQLANAGKQGEALAAKLSGAARELAELAARQKA